MAQEIISPQKGFQVDSLSTSADIAFLGGAAGAGKTFVLLMEACRYLNVTDFGGVIFRRTSPQIRNEGGLWDTSKKLFYAIGGKPKEVTTEWNFEAGTKLKFNHLQYDSTALDWQGSQIPFIGFDELTHFSQYQFLYMLSRNRSTCGVRPYVRATMNPDPESWVYHWIEWYINEDTGYPIPERSGKLRYFLRLSDNMIWGDSKQEVLDIVMKDSGFMEVLEESQAAGLCAEDLVKSFTFIPGSIYQNAELLKTNPDYLGNLLSLSEEEQLQLLRGNWKISMDGLALFQWDAVKQIFDNYATMSNINCITCDAAQFGRDLCVVFTWRGWEVVKINVLSLSDPKDICRVIELERQQWGIPKDRVLVDQDGVGGGTVKMGGYRGFSGGAQPLFDRDNRGKENYANLKTQCFYRVAEENVNVNNIRITITAQNCVIDGHYTTKIKQGSKVVDVRDLIKADLRAIKRRPRDDDGKLRINDKDEQKIILNGRSPDFGDNIGMRKWFDIAFRPMTVNNR